MLPTARFDYRRATPADAPFILELLRSPGWLRYIGDRGVYNLDDSLSYIKEKLLPAYEHPGCGPMLAVRRSDGTVVGNVGVYRRPGLDVPDFGFAFLPEFHGQGCAYEASCSGLEYAFRHGHRELLAITLPENTASLGLLTKLEFIADPEPIRLPGDEEELLLLRRQLTEDSLPPLTTSD